MYDVDLVQSLIHKFTMHIGCSFVDKNGSRYKEFNLDDESLLALGKLIDGYLNEIANDPNLSISRFSKLSESIPDSARPVHDGLYTAIDIYLKEHPDLMKADKRRICNLINVRKLSSEAYVHAAQNERLPLRTVVQVLFFEQLKASRSAPAMTDNASVPRTTMDEEWEGRVVSEHQCSLKQQLGSLKIKVDDCRSSDDKRSKSMSEKGSGSLLSSSSRSRRLFDKLWAAKGETIRSSETSGSSQSPPISVKPGEAKSCGSSRHIRYSSLSQNPS